MHLLIVGLKENVPLRETNIMMSLRAEKSKCMEHLFSEIVIAFLFNIKVDKVDKMFRTI